MTSRTRRAVVALTAFALAVASIGPVRAYVGAYRPASG